MIQQSNNNTIQMTQETETQLINVLTRIADALEKGAKPFRATASTKPAQQGGANVIPQAGVEDVSIRVESIKQFKNGTGNAFHGVLLDGNDTPACLMVKTDMCATVFPVNSTVRCWATRKAEPNYKGEIDFWYSSPIEIIGDTPQKPEQTTAIKQTSDIDQDVPF